jgi:hypothetical protein
MGTVPATWEVVDAHEVKDYFPEGKAYVAGRKLPYVHPTPEWNP